MTSRQGLKQAWTAHLTLNVRFWLISSRASPDSIILVSDIQIPDTVETFVGKVGVHEGDSFGSLKLHLSLPKNWD